jgi:hypothetical protein
MLILHEEEYFYIICKSIIQVLIVRYCQINTMPCVEKKDLLVIQTAELPPHTPPEVREQQLG